jgi:hypothetical protein
MKAIILCNKLILKRKKLKTVQSKNKQYNKITNTIFSSSVPSLQKVLLDRENQNV